MPVVAGRNPSILVRSTLDIFCNFATRMVCGYTNTLQTCMSFPRSYSLWFQLNCYSHRRQSHISNKNTKGFSVGDARCCFNCRTQKCPLSERKFPAIGHIPVFNESFLVGGALINYLGVVQAKAF